MVFVANLPHYFERKQCRYNRAVRSLSWTIAECPIFMIVERDVLIHHDDTDCDGDSSELLYHTDNPRHRRHRQRGEIR